MIRLSLSIIICFSIFHLQEIKAQVQTGANLNPNLCRIDQVEKIIYFGKHPVLGLSLSGFVIEDNTGIAQFENWNNLDNEKISSYLEISKYSENILHLTLNIKTSSSLNIKDLHLKFDFLPHNKELWEKARHDFHWIPNIKSDSLQFASDHVFRSPSVMMMTGKVAAALIPDVMILSGNRPAPHYLDMRFDEKEAPEIIYGLAKYKVDEHVYYSRSGEPFNLNGGDLRIGFYLIIDENTTASKLVSDVNRLLWKENGHAYTSQMEPQTIPFDKYADYGYDMALDHLWVKGVYQNSGGITLATYYDKETQRYGGRFFPMDLWFHSWFNNMRTAYGLYLWGEKTNNPEWKQRANDVKNLILNAPVDNGFFMTIYNSQSGTWVSSGQGGGDNVYHIPDNAWTAYWLMRFNQDCEKDERINEFNVNFALALISIQQSDGSFPTRIFVEDLKPDSVLNGSASEGLAIWYLAEMRLRSLIPESYIDRVDQAIRRGLDHIEKSILPRQKFEDFELYFSCSEKPLDFYDSVSEMYGQNTLSIQWCAEAFRAGYLLLKSEQDLHNALFCIDMLCLFQQVWNPDYLNFHGFGGFGVMNTDGEWNDARQAQFAETLAGFYELTGNPEYLERAVSAARASFALMIIPENQYVAPRNYMPESGLNIMGAMAENYGHCGYDCKSGQSGFHWGTGSALCTAIILQKKYGDLFISSSLNHAVGINGIAVENFAFKKNKINLSIKKIPSENAYSGKIFSGYSQQLRLRINNRKISINNAKDSKRWVLVIGERKYTVEQKRVN